MPETSYQRLCRLIHQTVEGDACLNWDGAKDEHGYGRVYPPRAKSRKKTPRAHVWAYALSHGLQPPLGFVVRHTCDNTSCVRPSHLIAGTQADNVHDAIERGRFLPKGQHHNMAKLTDSKVLEIRRMYDARTIGNFRMQKHLASMFGVSRGSIQGIVERKRWTHI